MNEDSFPPRIPRTEVDRIERAKERAQKKSRIAAVRALLQANCLLGLVAAPRVGR